MSLPTAFGAVWAHSVNPRWTLRRLKDVAKVVNGFPFNSSLFDADGAHALVRIRDLNAVETETRYNGPWVEAAAVKTGDVLIGMDGDFNVGVWRGGPALLNQRMCCVRGESPLMTKFLAYVLPAPLKVTNDLTYYTTVKHLSSRDVERFTLLVPPPEELEQVVNFLDEQTARIDALIAEKERLLAALDELPNAYAFKLATQGHHDEARETGRLEPWLARIPSHWTFPKLGYLADVGNGSTPSRENLTYWQDGSVPWLTSSAVNSEHIEEANQFVTELALRQCHLPLVRAGSTIVGLIGQGPTRGMAAHLRFQATLSQNVAYVTSRDSRRLHDHFLTLSLRGLYTAMRWLSDGVGGAQGALNCESLRSLRIPLPPPEEQYALVQEYDSHRAAVADLQSHVREHIARLREYRSSLISAAVTGKLNIEAHQSKVPEPA